MTYPGSPELSAQAQERVMTTFRQIVSKIQDGLVEEAKVGLDFVLRLDPTFAPGLEMQRQLATGRGSIDLTELISHLDAPSTDTINILLVEAVEEFNQRNYLEAKEKVSKVLLDLPGHAEARNLLGQVEEALKIETQVGQFLSQAREAIDRGDPEEAANFVMMAQALDPHHRGIQGMLVKLQSPDLKPGPTPAPPEQPAIQPSPDGAPTSGPDHPPPPPAPEASPSGEHPDDQDSWNIANAFSDAEPASPGPDDVSQPAAPSEDSDFDDFFAIDSSDDALPKPAAAATAPVPSAPSPPPAVDDPGLKPEPDSPLERSGPAFDDSSGDLADLFQSDPALGDPLAFDAEPAPSFDPIDDRSAQIQSLVEDAKTALASGDSSRARDILEGVLATDPGHNEALDLIEDIERAADADVPETVPPEAPPTAAGAPPDEPLDDDSDPTLFAQEFAPPEPIAMTSLDEARAPDRQHVAASRSVSGPRSPLRLAILVGGSLVIVLATMWLGRGFFSSEKNAEEERAQAVTRVLQEAESFYEQGKPEEALHLLQSYPAEGIEKQRIDKRIARYQESLAPPLPTPVPEAFIQGRALIDQGDWPAAYAAVDAGLRNNPDDPGLRDLYKEIAAIEPEIVPLYASLNNRDFATAASISSDLEEQHQDQAGLSSIHERCLFNAALTELRSYNLVGARSYLESLKRRQPQDPDLLRILEFISSYSNRSVDMQLEIFVSSLEER